MRLPRTARGARAGFTLVELTIAGSLVVLVLGSAALVTLTSTDAQNRSNLETRVQALARRALDRVADELTNTGQGLLLPDPGIFGTSDMTFQVVTGLAGAAPALSLPRQLRLRYDTGELDNGLDDDGDGLVDEGVLELIVEQGSPQEKTIVLCRGVCELLEGELPNGLDDNGNGFDDEPGFFVVRQEGVLILRLSVERFDSDGKRAIATMETGVRLRN